MSFDTSDMQTDFMLFVLDKPVCYIIQSEPSHLYISGSPTCSGGVSGSLCASVWTKFLLSVSALARISSDLALSHSEISWQNSRDRKSISAQMSTVMKIMDNVDIVMSPFKC